MEMRKKTMITLPVAASGEFKLVPEATYAMKLVDMQEAEQNENSPFYDPNRPRVKWVFQIVSVLDGDPDPTYGDPEDFIGEEFFGYTSLNMGKRATMRAWAQGLLGREIEDGEQITSEDLIGKIGRCHVEHYEKQNGATGHKISAIKPYRKAKAKPEPVFEEDDEDPF